MVHTAAHFFFRPGSINADSRHPGVRFSEQPCRKQSHMAVHQEYVRIVLPFAAMLRYTALIDGTVNARAFRLEKWPAVL